MRTQTSGSIWLQKCSSLQLTDGRDTIKWILTQSGQYSVHSLYVALVNFNISFPHKFIWETKLPLKIKVFMWYICKGVILTEDNLCKRNWKKQDKWCCFCSSHETIEHLFLKCPVAQYVWIVVAVSFDFSPPSSIAHMFGIWLSGFGKSIQRQMCVGIAAPCWAIWRARNAACFDRKWPSHPNQIVFAMCHWLCTWKILQGQEAHRLGAGCKEDGIGGY